jgi:general secretion pathway protein E
MLDLGVEPYLLASSLLGVLAQRLVRRICPDCRREYSPTGEELFRYAIPAEEMQGKAFYKGAGCPACQNTGYRERMGIFELLVVCENVRELILHRGKASSIKNQAMQCGMTTLAGDGMSKAQAGSTTLEEVFRVTGRDDF